MAKTGIKENIFTKFDKINRDAGLGKKYAVHCFFRYTDNFDKDEREIVEKFRKEFDESESDITVLASKYSDREIDIIDRFIGFVQGLPDSSFTGWLRWLFSRRRSSKMRVYRKNKRQEQVTGVKTSSKDEPVKMASLADYLKNRLRSQQNFFSKKATECKDTYHKNQKIIMAISVSISVISLIQVLFGDIWCAILKVEDPPAWISSSFNVIIAAVSAIAAYVSSNDKLFQHLSFWAKFRVASEKLKSEQALYEGRCGIYDVPNDSPDEEGHYKADKIFRERVEQIVQEANDNFSQMLQNDKDKGGVSEQIKSYRPPAFRRKVDEPAAAQSESQPESKPEPEPEPETVADAADSDFDDLPAQEDLPEIADEEAEPASEPASDTGDADFVEKDAQG